MKILHIYKDYFPVMGGIENLVRWLAEAQTAEGHEVTVLTASLTNRTFTETVNGVTIHRVRRWGTVASTPLTPTLPLAICRFQPDIAHIQSPYPPGEFFNALLGRAKFTVISYQSDVVRQKTLLKFYGPWLRWALKKANRILPSSTNYIETSDFLRPHRDKCRVVHIGIDPARFAKSPPLAVELRQKWGAPLILFVGRLRYYKGLNTLISALSAVPQGKLLLVGDGPLKASLVAQVARLGLEKRVIFAGSISDADLPAYFHASDLFVLPSNSRAEAFGIVLLEAMAAGLPLISTELGTGTSFINRHGETGWVVPPENSAALAEAIIRILGNSAEQRQFGAAARARVQSEFTIDRMTTQVMGVYRELLEA